MNKRHRPLFEIAAEVWAHYPRINPVARPYLEALGCLASVNDACGPDGARGIIAKFLATCTGFRGPDAARLKGELRSIMNDYR